jgi:hypothetical protein
VNERTKAEHTVLLNSGVKVTALCNKGGAVSQKRRNRDQFSGFQNQTVIAL